MFNCYVSTEIVCRKETRIHWGAIGSDIHKWAVNHFTDARCAVATVIHSGCRLYGQVKRQAVAIGFALAVAGIAYQSVVGGVRLS